jgi:hypothetical protein
MNVRILSRFQLPDRSFFGKKMPAMEIAGLCLPLKPQKEKFHCSSALINQNTVYKLGRGCMRFRCLSTMLTKQILN